MEIGKRIRQRRQILELTQQELADELGVTHQHVSRIEAGQVAPSLELLVKFAARLGCSSDWLLTGEQRPMRSAKEAIRAESALSPAAKRHLVGLIEELSR